MRKSSMTLRAVGAAALTTGLVVAGASVASAHVTVTPNVTTAGSYGVLTFALSHGCDGSATTKVSIQMPEQVITVAPTVNAGWDVEKVMEDLDTPVDDGHGGQYTERVSEVVYTATTPLADGYRDAFELSLKLPEAAGETLIFPTVQTCEEGETAWVQVPAEGEVADDLESPAPAFVLTAAEESADAADGTAAEDVAAEDADESANQAASEDGAATATTSDDAATPVVTWVALALGAAGLVLGLLAFLRTRRTQD
ncbi:YcnI family protein [Cellulosimicrobium terreum]|nr:YcnI family protein [Cellulosimicrobium terreum]